MTNSNFTYATISPIYENIDLYVNFTRSPPRHVHMYNCAVDIINMKAQSVNITQSNIVDLEKIVVDGPFYMKKTNVTLVS